MSIDSDWMTALFSHTKTRPGESDYSRLRRSAPGWIGAKPSLYERLQGWLKFSPKCLDGCFESSIRQQICGSGTRIFFANP